MKILTIFTNACKHLKRVLTHKYWVLYYCHKAGITWQGIIHDLSKFSWTEFSESVLYYDPNKSPIELAKADKGYSEAWFHHRSRNPHHHVYWTDNYDEGITAIKMPTKYAIELICDYLGAGKTYWGNNFSFEQEFKWWLKRRKQLKMHVATKRFVDYMLFLCWEFNSAAPLKDAEYLAVSLKDRFNDTPISDEQYDSNELLISVDDSKICNEPTLTIFTDTPVVEP